MTINKVHTYDLIFIEGKYTYFLKRMNNNSTFNFFCLSITRIVKATGKIPNLFDRINRHVPVSVFGLKIMQSNTITIFH